LFAERYISGRVSTREYRASTQFAAVCGVAMQNPGGVRAGPMIAAPANHLDGAESVSGGDQDVIPKCFPRHRHSQRHRLETVENGAVRRGVSSMSAAHN
jgi:hypothetical protein